MKQVKSTNQKIENEQDIKELALKYLDKYQPSKKDLKLYLFRKLSNQNTNTIPKNQIFHETAKTSRLEDLLTSNRSSRSQRQFPDIETVPKY